MYANLYPSADVCLKHLFFCAKCIGVSSSWLFEVSTVVFFTSCLTWKKWGVVVVWVCRTMPLVTCFVCLDSCITEQKENTGRFILFSVITNIYNKKAKGPTLMELFTATGKLIFFWQLEMFDVCTTGDTAHYSSSCHTRVNMLTRVWQELKYRIDVYRVTRVEHIEQL